MKQIQCRLCVLTNVNNWSQPQQTSPSPHCMVLAPGEFNGTTLYYNAIVEFVIL